MQKKAYGLFFVTILILITMIVLPGCTSTSVSPSPSTGTPSAAIGNTASISASVLTSPQTKPSLTPPGFSLENSQKELKEKGSTLTDTADKASQLAGFKVATASFIPEGFIPRDYNGQGGLFFISKPGFGVETAEDIPHAVEQRYLKKDPQGLYAPYIVVLQTPNPARMSFLTEDATVGKYSGKKALIPPEGAYHNRMALSWYDGSLAYYLEGELSPLLEEAALYKMAESIGVH